MKKSTMVAASLRSSSYKIIKKNKQILLFQLIYICILVPMLFAAIPHLGHIENIAIKTNHLSGKQYTLLIFFILCFFFILNFLNTFANIATCLFTINYVKNKKASAINCLAITCKKIGIIYVWTLFITTIGIAINLCQIWMDNWQEKKIATKWLHKLNLKIAILLTPSVLACDNFWPIKTLTTSSKLIANTWQHTNKETFKSGYKILIFKICSLIPFLIGLKIGSNSAQNIGLIITCVFYFGCTILTQTSHAVNLAAIYLFAKKEEAIEEFYNKADLEKAFY